MDTKYVQLCLWCGKGFLSYYSRETICSNCDGKLIERTHEIFSGMEVEELLLNGTPLKVIYEIVDKSETKIEAILNLRNEINSQLESFLS